MEESQQETPLTTSTETQPTTGKKTFKRFASRVTTPKPEEKQVSDLMAEHGVTWGMHNGRRILNFPCSCSDTGREAIYRALKEGR